MTTVDIILMCVQGKRTALKNHVLNNKLGHCTKIQAHIELLPNTTPKFCKARPIPFAYMDGVKGDHIRYEQRE